MILKEIASPVERWESIEVGPSEHIDVLLRSPTFGERIADYEAAIQAGRYGATTEQRLRTCVVGWRGVTDAAGNPIAFSWERLRMLCVQSPTTLLLLASAVGVLYIAGPTEDSEKNSQPPSGDGSQAATAESAPPSDSSASSVPLEKFA